MRVLAGLAERLGGKTAFSEETGAAGRCPMTPHSHPKARNVLQALIQGVDPDTGSELPPDTVLNRPDVLRALLTGLAALDTVQARALRRAQLPASVGKSWTEEEELQLKEAYQKQHMPVPDIAVKQGRTVRAIEARLERLGLLRAEERTTSSLFMSVSTGKEGKP